MEIDTLETIERAAITRESLAIEIESSLEIIVMIDIMDLEMNTLVIEEILVTMIMIGLILHLATLDVMKETIEMMREENLLVTVIETIDLLSAQIILLVALMMTQDTQEEEIAISEIPIQTKTLEDSTLMMKEDEMTILSEEIEMTKEEKREHLQSHLAMILLKRIKTEQVQLLVG